LESWIDLNGNALTGPVHPASGNWIGYTNAGGFYTPDRGGLSAVDLKNPTSWNMYAYVGDDPVNFTDKRGLYPCIAGYGSDGVPDWTDCEVAGILQTAPQQTIADYDDFHGLPLSTKTIPPNLQFGGDVTKKFQNAWSKAWDDLNKVPCAKDFGWSTSDLHDLFQNANYQYLKNYYTNNLTTLTMVRLIQTTLLQQILQPKRLQSIRPAPSALWETLSSRSEGRPP
jgi:hypothetical protein